MLFSDDIDLLAWIMLIPVITLFGFGMSNTDKPIHIVLLTLGLIGGFGCIYIITNKLKKNSYVYKKKDLELDSENETDYNLSDYEF